MKFPRLPWLLVAAALPLAMTAFGQTPPAPPTPAAPPEKPVLGSKIWKWEEMEVKKTGVGERRDINDGPTPTLETFECHITTLNPGNVSHPPHRHAQEEFIILKEGQLDVHINGRETRVGPGAMFFFASNDWHAVNNIGRIPATYLVFNLRTAKTRTAPKDGAELAAVPGLMGSVVCDWEKLDVTKTKVGERRALFDSPTTTCANLEAHVTTLNAGETPHAPHRHPDEELIIVKEGTVEVTIEGRSERIGPGSIAFLAANDEHGLRNVGEGAATYYVVRMVTERTPKPAKT